MLLPTNGTLPRPRSLDFQLSRSATPSTPTHNNTNTYPLPPPPPPNPTASLRNQPASAPVSERPSRLVPLEENSAFVADNPITMHQRDSPLSWRTPPFSPPPASRAMPVISPPSPSPSTVGIGLALFPPRSQRTSKAPAASRATPLPHDIGDLDHAASGWRCCCPRAARRGMSLL